MCEEDATAHHNALFQERCVGVGVGVSEGARVGVDGWCGCGCGCVHVGVFVRMFVCAHMCLYEGGCIKCCKACTCDDALSLRCSSLHARSSVQCGSICISLVPVFSVPTCLSHSAAALPHSPSRFSAAPCSVAVPVSLTPCVQCTHVPLIHRCSTASQHLTFFGTSTDSTEKGTDKSAHTRTHSCAYV